MGNDFTNVKPQSPLLPSLRAAEKNLYRVVNFNGCVAICSLCWSFL